MSSLFSSPKPKLPPPPPSTPTRADASRSLVSTGPDSRPPPGSLISGAGALTSTKSSKRSLIGGAQ